MNEEGRIVLGDAWLVTTEDRVAKGGKRFAERAERCTREQERVRLKKERSTSRKKRFTSTADWLACDGTGVSRRQVCGPRDYRRASHCGRPRPRQAYGDTRIHTTDVRRPPHPTSNAV